MFLSDLRKKATTSKVDGLTHYSDFLLINGPSRITSTRTRPDVQPGNEKKLRPALSEDGGLPRFALSPLSMPLSTYPIVGVDGLGDALGLLRLLLLLVAVVLGGGAPAGGRGRLLLLLLLLQLGDLALRLGDLPVNL